MHHFPLLPLFTSLATAIPFSISPHLLSSSAPNCNPAGPNTSPGVYYCTNDNFLGKCNWRPYADTDDWCLDFSDGLTHRPRSIAPDVGGYCELFNQPGCRGDTEKIWKGMDHTRLECPGMSDSGLPGWFQSVRCRKG
jgi:hypothetical protein